MNPKIPKFLYAVTQTLRGEKVLNYLKYLEKTQWYPPDQLRELQWKKLKDLMHHAYQNVPYYRMRFDNLGLVPEDIKNPSDFRRLPLLTKDDIRNNLSDLRAKNYQGFVFHSSTSGSTGKPLFFYKSKLASAAFLAAKYRGHRWYNLDVGDKEVKFWGLQLAFLPRQKEKIKNFILNRTLFSVFDLSEETLLSYFKECQHRRPKYLYGYANALYRFAEFLRNKRLDAKGLDLKLVIYTSEMLYKPQREVIEETFGCKAVSEYGAIETGIIAFECPEGGMHVTAENVYLEFLRGGRPVVPGEIGEIVVTELNSYAMPFIRYRIGDVGRSSNKTCGCGRGLPLMSIVEGRTRDVVVAADGSYVHVVVFYYIFKGLEHKGVKIREFRIIQKSRRDLVVLLVSDISLPNTALEYLRSQIYRFMGQDVKIVIRQVHSIPRDRSGKLRCFISEVPLNIAEKNIPQ